MQVKIVFWNAQVETSGKFMIYKIEDLMNEDEGLMAGFTEAEKQEIMETAHHEAAHAVVGIQSGFDFQGVNLNSPYEGGGGWCAWGDDLEEKKLSEMTEQDITRLKKSIVKAAAGLEGELRLGKVVDDSQRRLDFEDDDAFIKKSCLGLSSLEHKSAEDLEKELRERARQIVDENWDDIEILAVQLSKRFKLNRQAVQELLPCLF